jgi:pimeloyl-ACP methyl ester carboxylesterase
MGSMGILAPGRLVEVEGRKIHVQEQGSGRATVVFEAGIAASSISWALVQGRVGEFARTLSYDRAGFGWSDEAPAQATALDAAEDLGRLLDAVGAKGPLVLVGHSFGGLIVRVFQQRWPERVAGMVLVDPVIRAEWRDVSPERAAMLGRGVMLSRRGATLARLGIVRLALKLLTSGNQRIPKLLARVSAGKGSRVTDRLVGEVRKMPREAWPAIAQHWSQTHSFLAMARNLENLPVSAAQLAEETGLGSLPVRIVSAGRSSSGTANPEHLRDAALSSEGLCVVAPTAGHWVQLDDPDLVVETIREVVALAGSVHLDVS